MLYGFYEVWGILQLLALQPAGDAIRDDKPIDMILRDKMKATLRHINDAGDVPSVITSVGCCVVMFSWWTGELSTCG